MPDNLRRLAKSRAVSDKKNGLSCDPTRWDATPGSIWAEWYESEYRRCSGNKLTEEQFEALCRIRAVREGSRGTEALRSVLVDGLTGAKAADKHHVSRQAVYATLGASRAVVRDAQVLAGVEL